MPRMSTVLLVICINIALGSIGQGAPILDDLFGGFVRDSQLAINPAKEGTIVKRRIYADNPDGRLKQVSLQSLIGDVEDSLYNTALSVSSVAHNHEDVVPEITPQSEADDERTKRATEDKQAATTAIANNGQFVTTEPTPQSKDIYLQTTQKVPAANGVPAHILIDRVAVQPHQGGLPFIPAFQVYHTKVISATFKEPSTSSNADGSNADGGPKATKVSITQTSVQTSNTAGGVPVITIATTNPSASTETAATPAEATTILDTTKSAATTIHLQNVPVANLNAAAAVTEPLSTSTSSTESSTTTTTTTTKLPIVQLKEAEEELKEKVAEIEAEPVILSARV